jgi:WD40 repeat protein
VENFPSFARSRRRINGCCGATLLAAQVAGLVGCASAPPPAPRPPPAIDQQQIQQAVARMMGRAPAPRAIPTPGGIEVVVGTGHTAPIVTVAASLDGRFVLSASVDETVRLWDTAAGQEIRSIPNASLAPALALGFSADGTRALIGYGEGAQLLDTTTGALVARLDAGDMAGGMTPLLLSSSGRVVSAQLSNGAAIIDGSSGAVLWSVPAAERLQQVALNDDGTILALRPANAAQLDRSAVGMLRYDIQLWNVGARRLQSRVAVQQRKGFAGRIALSPNGRLLGVEVGDGSLQLYDTAGGAVAATLVTAAAAPRLAMSTLAFSPDGTLLAYSSVYGIARLWRVADRALVASLEASALSFSADGRQLVLGKPDGGAPILYDLHSGRETPVASGASEVVDLSLIAGGAAAVTAAGPGGAKVWDLASGQLVASLPCPDAGSARSVAASPARSLVAIGCADGSVSLTELAAPYVTRLLRPASPQHAFSNALVRFDGDGRRLVTVVEDELAVWDVGSGQALQRVRLPPAPPPPSMPGFAPGSTARAEASAPAPQRAAASEVELMTSPDRVQALAVRADGAVAAIGRATELGVWDLSSGRMIGRLAPPSPTAAGAAPGQLGSLPGFFGAVPGRSGAAGASPASIDLGGMFQAFNPQRNGATGLAFSPNGRVLLASGSYGQRLWDLQSGQEIRLRPASAGVRGATPPAATDPMALLGQLEMASSFAAALSLDGRVAARAYGQGIRLVDLTSGTQVAELTGHTSTVTALAFSGDGRRLVSCARDGSLRVWSLATGREAVAMYAVGRSDFVAVTPDRYYRVSRHQLQSVAFRVGDQLFPFEQFDLRFNRPDLVMERLGLAPEALVAAYRHAYEKRLKKMGFASGALGADLHLPGLAVLSHDLPVTTAATTVNIRVRASDNAVALDRINVYVNDVPVYGSAGLPVAPGAQAEERDLEVPLVAGHNKIQVSVLNRLGAESLRRTLYTTSTASPEPWDAWVVAIGVSAYRNPRYALRFAAKDAADLAQAFRALDGRLGAHRSVHVLLLTDQDATRSGIRAAKQWLQQAHRQDLAVVFAAGHGIVDDSQNYFYGTWDIDADNPAAAGLPFEDFEDLLDGIQPLRKVLLVDTCFSGEIDKDEVRTVASAEDGNRVTMREYKAARNIVSLAGAQSTASTSSEPAAALILQQDLFADLRRGTGAVVISSSSGNEYSLEGAQWSNGVFTYSILQGLTAGRADRNGDGVVTVSELQSYVIDEVRRLTRGAQNPTARRENLDFDFAVY